MLRSMYSGISGLRNSQTKLDVVGNNIANVNTYGFKKGRTTFKDMVSQNMAGATGSSIPTTNIGGYGGTNPKQVGLGAQIASIDTIATQGSLQTTNRTLDLGVSGDGYFTVFDGANTPLYTRAGNFYLDAEGNLVTSDGYSLVGAMYIGIATDHTFNTPQGGGQQAVKKSVSAGIPVTKADRGTPGSATKLPEKTATATPTPGGGTAPNTAADNVPYRKLFIPSEVASIQIVDPKTKEVQYRLPTADESTVPLKLQSYSIGQDGTINAIYEGDKQPRVIGQIQVTKFANAEGLEKTGGNLYTVTSNSGEPQEVWPQSGGGGSVVSGTLEMSNVDLSEEFTEMIVGQRSFQANSRIITTSDEILQELVNLKR